MEELLDRLQSGIHRGEAGATDQPTHGRMRFKNSVQRRDLKDEEYLDRELWRKINMSGFR
jgi:hypothetical protein